MLGLSFLSMYAVIFFNVASFDHIYLSTTRLYMTLLMISPMALIMLGLMWNMYGDTRVNWGILLGSIFVFIFSFWGLRTQTPIGDVQYMRAMIPHHSSAILTSEQANLENPEVQQLAREIIEAQKEEIAEMKQLLQELKRK